MGYAQIVIFGKPEADTELVEEITAFIKLLEKELMTLLLKFCRGSVSASVSYSLYK